MQVGLPVSADSSAARRPWKRLTLEPLEPRRVLADVTGTILTDTVWTELQSPFEVKGDVTVARGATLTIEPGVVVRLDNGTGITVRGRFVAEGTAFRRVTLEPADGASRWDGLHFDNTPRDNRISHTDMPIAITAAT